MILPALVCLAPFASPVLYTELRPGWILLKEMPFGSEPGPTDVERLRLRNPKGTQVFSVAAHAASSDRGTILAVVGGSSWSDPACFYLLRRGKPALRLTRGRIAGLVASWVSADGRRYAFGFADERGILRGYLGGNGDAPPRCVLERPIALSREDGSIGEVEGKLFWCLGPRLGVVSIDARGKVRRELEPGFDLFAPRQNVAARIDRSGSEGLTQLSLFRRAAPSGRTRKSGPQGMPFGPVPTGAILGPDGRTGIWSGRPGFERWGGCLDLARERFAAVEGVDGPARPFRGDRLVWETGYGSQYNLRIALKQVVIPAAAWRPLLSQDYRSVRATVTTLMTMPNQEFVPAFLLDSPNTIFPMTPPRAVESPRFPPLCAPPPSETPVIDLSPPPPSGPKRPPSVD